MRLVVWKSPFSEFIVRSLRRDEFLPDTVSLAPWKECEKYLFDGRADVAFIPTLRAIKTATDIEVLPAVALSSWDYPFTRIILRDGLGKPLEKVRYSDVSEQEIVLARIILGEHYGQKPHFIGPEDEETDPLPGQGEARLVQDSDGRKGHAGLILDLGREWYELANYPMVWGVFVSLKGINRTDEVKLLRRWVRNVETHREKLVNELVADESKRDYFREQLRFRFDDLAIASLTEFRQFLYYYDVMDEIPELQFSAIDDEEDNEPTPLL